MPHGTQVLIPTSARHDGRDMALRGRCPAFGAPPQASDDDISRRAISCYAYHARHKLLCCHEHVFHATFRLIAHLIVRLPKRLLWPIISAISHFATISLAA